MRYLIDTCIFIHYALERDKLSDDVLSILEDYDNTICVSAETLRELIIQYNNGKLVSKYWKSARAMVDSIKDELFIDILPLSPHRKVNAGWHERKKHGGLNFPTFFFQQRIYKDYTDLNPIKTLHYNKR